MHSTQNTAGSQLLQRCWGRLKQTNEPITKNDTEKQIAGSISNLDLSSLFREGRRRAVTVMCPDILQTEPVSVSTRTSSHVHVSLYESVCARGWMHDCVCGLFIWWWITRLWGSQLTSFCHASSHWSLPQSLASCPQCLCCLKKTLWIVRN